MNILVAVDLSEATELVVEAARGVAELTGASIYVCHVIETEPDYVNEKADPETRQVQVAVDYPREHEGVLRLATQLQDDGLDATDWLARGPAVETALKQAEELDAGLIVLGSHGHGAVYDVLIGSFSAGIIRKSKLPVLVVPVR